MRPTALRVGLALLVPLLLAGGASRAGTSAQGPPTQFAGKTDWADFHVLQFFPDGNGEWLVDVMVSRGLTRGRGTTFLVYRIVRCQFTFPAHCADIEAGSGLIPNTDLSGSATGTLVLMTDTGAEANPAFTRSAGAGGLLHVRWKRSEELQTTQSGSVASTAGGTTVMTSGTFRSTTATVDGRVMTLPDAFSHRVVWGAMSTQAAVTIEVTRH